MNIKEIAKLAGVSVATVSKVINRKDQKISAETRNRVLQIVKENNYTPYADVSMQRAAKTFLIAIALDASQNHETLGSFLIEAFRREGYTAIVCRSASAEDEFKNLSALCSYQLDGIVWDRRQDADERSLGIVKAKGVPFHLMDAFAPSTPNNACVDYQKIGYAATRQLIEQKHKQMFCAAERRGYQEERFFQGFQLACLHSHIPADDNRFCVLEEHGGEIPSQVLLSSTGAVTFSEAVASYLYGLLTKKNRRVPKHFSVVGVEDSERPNYLQPALTSVIVPYKALAEHVCRRLTAEMEARRAIEVSFETRPGLSAGQSVDVPSDFLKRKVVVVGAINMDTLISLDAFPRMGETTLVQSVAVMPGGKGLNQSIGIANLGVEAYLIGKIGRDYDGAEAFNFLQDCRVNVEGVSNTSKADTGRAYIHVQRNGESGIAIFRGANTSLSSHEISQNIFAFENASFCLLQTEVDMDAVEFAARLAFNEHVKILLKPAATDSVPDSVLQKVFVFLPNEREIQRLCPERQPLEEKAAYFLEKGVKNVIITLGSKGCYWSDGVNSRYFDAVSFRTVDTTGAADAFAAALVVCLIRGYPMETSIRYASFAAGFSTTKLGACTAMIDQSTLDFYIHSQQTEKEIANLEAEGSRGQFLR